MTFSINSSLISGEHNVVVQGTIRCGDVARIDHEFGVAHDHLIVDVMMARHDYDGVDGPDQFRREVRREHVRLQMPGTQMGYPGIVIRDTREFGMQLPNNRKGGRLPDIVDVGLIGNANQQDAGVLKGLPVEIEPLGDTVDHVNR